jgi:hypothetical protein
MPKKSTADHNLEWSRLIATVRTNAGDVPYLLELSSELEIVLGGVRKLEIKRSALDAQRYQTTRDIQGLKGRGRILAARMRSGLNTKYGFGSEKLIEFGMSPRRRRIADESAEKEAVAKIMESDPDS